ncbi:MAG: glycosyltransferase family 4 protein [Candidatus Omnitrophota bacterium]
MPKVNLMFCLTKLELGGAQKQLLSLITRLDKTKFKVFLFTAKDGLLLADAQVINGLELTRSHFLERPINPFKDVLALREIYRFIISHNIDIVHTHSSKAGILGRLAAKLAGVKIIIHTVHGWPFHDYQPFWQRKFLIWLECVMAKFTDRIITVSKWDLAKGLSYGIAKENKYSLVYCGVNQAEFQQDGRGVRNEFGIGQADLLIGNISCFKPQKSPLDFIRLAYLVNQAMPEVKFILVGDGILRLKTERLIRKLHLQEKVILCGWRRDIPQVLSALDIFVLTSLWEGLPITALEAMAAAKPIVATDTGGVKEIINSGENGFLVPCKDMLQMAEKVILLLKYSGLRRKLGVNARASLRADFNLEYSTGKIENLYQNLLQATAI